MASETLSNLTAALSQFYSVKLEDQRNTRTEALEFIPIVPCDSGKNVAWDVKFTGSKAAAAFSPGSDVTSGEFTNTVKKAASLGFGYYRAPVKVDDDAALLAAVAKGSPDELMDLIESNVMDSIDTLLSLINTDIFTGDGTDGSGNPNIVGFFGGALDSSGIYANLNRATDAEWEGNVLANGGTPRPLTDALLRAGEREAFTSGSRRKNAIIFTTPIIHEKYAGLFTPVQRIMTQGEMPRQFAMGTNELRWSDMPIVRDGDCSSGNLAMIHPDNVQLVVPASLYEITGLPRLDSRKIRQASNGAKTFPLPIVVEFLARAGNNTPINVWTMCQLRVKRPNETVWIKDISEA